MTEIKHKLVIKTTPDIIYNATTTQHGLESWWAKQTIAKPEVGFVNIFTFGTAKNEIKVTDLEPDKKVVWNVINSAEEWNGTTISFDLEEKTAKPFCVSIIAGGGLLLTSMQNVIMPGQIL